MVAGSGSEHSYERFMRQCSYDLDGLRVRMGDRWPAYEAYNVELARRPARPARVLPRGLERCAPTASRTRSVPLQQFMNPENIGRIIAAA